jgi:hypothetical protein
MIFEELLDDLKCSMPNKPEHFVQNEKILSCGHPVCTDCMQNNVGTTISCARCHMSTDRARLVMSSSDYINKISKRYIEAYLGEFSHVVDTKLERAIADLKSKYIRIQIIFSIRVSPCF